MISEHASPLAALGGADAGGQNVHVAALAAGLAQRGHDVTVHTRRDDPSLPDLVWDGAAGVADTVGLLAFYRALAVGRMGIAAPITAVLTAATPTVHDSTRSYSAAKSRTESCSARASGRSFSADSAF